MALSLADILDQFRYDVDKLPGLVAAYCTGTFEPARPRRGAQARERRAAAARILPARSLRLHHNPPDGPGPPPVHPRGCDRDPLRSGPEPGVPYPAPAACLTAPPTF